MLQGLSSIPPAPEFGIKLQPKVSPVQPVSLNVMSVGGSIIPWPKRYKKGGCGFLNPQDSTGIFYRKMGRDLSCWEAVGKARETFIRIAGQIKEYLETYSDPVPQPVTWTIYMIGRTKETSEPTIIFCCKDLQCRKQVRKTVEQSGILDQFQHIKVGEASQPPDFDQLVQLAEESFGSILNGLSSLNLNLEYYEDLQQHLYANTLAFAEDPGEAFCESIAVPFYNKERILISVRKATAGGVLKSGDRYFYLTAGHIFTATMNKVDSHASGSKGIGKESDFEFDLGEEADSRRSSLDINDFIEATSNGSITPEPDDSDSSGSGSDYFTSGSLCIDPSTRDVTHTHYAESSTSNHPNDESLENKPSLESLSVVVGHQVSSLESHSLPHLDYALIEIDEHFIAAGRPPRDDKWEPSLSQIHGYVTSPSDTEVICVTKSGFIAGTISGTPTYSTLPSSSKIQELWTVRLAGKLAIGDCGSLVVSPSRGVAFGHIVAGSPGSGVAHIVPTYQIIRDAKTTFGLDLEFDRPVEWITVKEANPEGPPLPAIPERTNLLDINALGGMKTGMLAESQPSPTTTMTTVSSNDNATLADTMGSILATESVTGESEVALETNPSISLAENTNDLEGSNVHTSPPAPHLGENNKNTPTNAVSKPCIETSTALGKGRGFYMAYLESLCRRRGWRDPLYDTYRSNAGFTCLVLVNGREYQTDLAYPSDGLAQENAAMRAFMVCRNFSVNGGMLARNGVVQGLPANESSGRRRRKYHGARNHYSSSAASATSGSSSASTASSE